MRASILDAAGTAAAEIATLFWWMTAGSVVVWLLAVGLGLYCARGRRLPHPERFVWGLILGGGVIVPSLLLSVLLYFGLRPLTRVQAASPEATTIAVAGEQWWWRVRYTLPDGTTVDAANELRLPVGHRTAVALASDNVLHAFWIPALAGKVDMVPGRATRVVLEPTTVGVFRGACAEYCGTSHARMDFRAEVMSAGAFDAWLGGQAADAIPADSVEARRGAELFTWHGCGACHAVRGTAAAGTIGPDLTHVGSRPSLATASMRNAPAEMAAWLAAPDQTKPGAHMPGFAMVGGDDLRALAAYLTGLR